MTGRQLPSQEHCGHECVCALLYVHDPDPEHKAPCENTFGCKHDTRGSSPKPVQPSIEITQRAYEVLKMMVEDNNPENFPFNSETISEWIMETWAGYCDVNGEPDVEAG